MIFQLFVHLEKNKLEKLVIDGYFIKLFFDFG